ncbi:CHAP domain-containing protein [Vermiculatibacterium agrestimuris]|uniref:CHAP domain-containing protein n=1 Tax=Vermiculatibacterium agrestimuris TaxID=2941519 RepID=UPI00203C379C|nr:CHAP domain-containing protein [Vermiculatibacterium agrestimuris]
MTEKELRHSVADILCQWQGAKKGDDRHRHIIDVYNSHRPLPRGVRMSYTMDWCAAAVSAAGIAAGLTDIMPPECSCGELIKRYKALGRWVEDDAYRPQVGDLMLYAWDDDGRGDCAKAPNHVGMVVDTVGETICVMEGNMGSDSRVGLREMRVDGRYIRGYCCPDYAAGAARRETEEENMKIYRYVAEMPAWAQAAATRAINNGVIKMDETGAAGVWEQNLQPLVWMDRLGLFGGPGGRA